MCSHFSKRIVAGLLLTFLSAVPAFTNDTRQGDVRDDRIVLTVNPVPPPYTNRLQDYFSAPGKIGGSILVKNELDASGYLFYVHVRLINLDTEHYVGTNPQYSPDNPREVILWPIPNTTQLQYSDLQGAMNEQNLRYVGFTREQIQRDGLPAGTYCVSMDLFVHLNGWGGGFRQVGTFSSPSFRIEEKKPVVSQMIQVMPPYTGKLEDYIGTPGKINSVITVTQYPRNPAWLHATASLERVDGSIRISSGEGSASIRIDGTQSGGTTLYPPYTLTYEDIRSMFMEPVRYQGITREQVQREGLPEGAYQMCITLTDSQVGGQVSSACSAPFLITPPAVTALEPPQIIQPYDGSELLPEQRQTLQFTWTRPPGAPAGTNYRLKIIELNERSGLNYRDMLRTDTYPSFFETTVGEIPTYLYTAADPPLNENRRYAFIVQAYSAIGTAPANFKNDGYSEPAVFAFAKERIVLPAWNDLQEDIPEERPSEEGLTVFIPACRDCNQGNGDLPFNPPSGGSTYRLLGNTLNPALSFSDPVAAAKTSILNVSVDIPADAIAVNNARNFYLRWEDKSKAFEKLRPRPGEGLVYRLRIFDAAGRRLVWQKDVWNSNSYEQTREGLPFRDGDKYLLRIEAVRGTVTSNGFSILDGKAGKPERIASSCDCPFTFMALQDVPDLEEYTVRGKLSYKFEHHPEKYPLTTTTATLTRYTVPADAGSGTPDPATAGRETWFETPKDDRHSVPIRINEDGTFEVTFHAYRNNGLIPVDPSVVTMKPIALREFFNLELNSPYYLQPGSNAKRSSATVVRLTDKVIDLGEITFNVWSYTLEVEVSKGYSKYGKEITGTYRELTPPNVAGEVSRLMFGLEGYENMPYYEGDIPASEPKNKYGKDLITKGKVEIKKGSDGKDHTFVTFDRLICNFQHNDRYYVNISQELEKDGSRKTYKANEFRGGYRFYPGELFLRSADLRGSTNFLVKRKATLIDDRPPVSSVKGQLVFADPSVNRSATQPLANTDIALVVTYLMMDGKGHRTVLDENHIEDLRGKQSGDAVKLTGNDRSSKVIEKVLGKFEDRNMVLATARTDADGNFEFKDFAQIDSLTAVLFKADEWVGGGEFGSRLQLDGTLKRTVRVVVNNRDKRFWLNPDTDIDVQPNTSVDAKILTAYLDTYKLRVRPIGDPFDDMTDPNKANQILRGVFVDIKRDPVYPGEPEERIAQEDYVKNESGPVFSVPKHLFNQSYFLPNENTISTKDMFNELKIRVFTKDIVGENACVEEMFGFPRDYYESGYARLPFLSSEERKKYHSAVSPDLFDRQNDGYWFTDDFKNLTYDLIVQMRPNEPVISGRVLDAENMSRSVEDGEVILRTAKPCFFIANDRTSWQTFTPEGFPKTRKVSNAKGNGYFSFDNLIPNIFVSGKYGPAEPLDPETVSLVSYMDLGLGGCQGSSDYQLCVKAKGYTLTEFREEGKEAVKSGTGNKWFPAEPMKPKMGQQIHFPLILMGPDGWITGCVIDEEGNALEARARTTRSLSKKTVNPPPGKSCAGAEHVPIGNTAGALWGHVLTLPSNNWFKVPAPSGYSDTLFVAPSNVSKYFSDTLLIPAMPEGEYNVGTVKLMERKHRIRVVAIPYSDTPTTMVAGIPDVTVRIEGAGEEKTGRDGAALFTFASPAENFHIELIPSDESGYIAVSTEKRNLASKKPVTYYIMLKKGATVSGKVTSDGKPVPGADVWVMNGNDKRQVKADADGRYTIRGLKPVVGFADEKPSGPSASGKLRAARTRPRQQAFVTRYMATVHCAPPQDNPEFSNLRGLDHEVSFTAEDGSATVDFELEIFYKANIRSLHGFGITVTDILEDGGDAYRISGTLDLDKVPGSFEIRNRMDQSAFFKNLKVRASAEKDEKGRPYLEAVGGAFGIGLKQLDVTLKAGGGHDYVVELGNDGDAFLKVTGDGATGGFIHSKARIKPNSFRFTDMDLAFGDDQFYLSDIGDEKPANGVTSFKSYLKKTGAPLSAAGGMVAEGSARDGMKPGGSLQTDALKRDDSFMLHDRKGGPMRFKFIAFEATSPLKESRLGTDGVITLKPDAWFINPLLEPVRKDTIRLNLPEIKMTPDEINRGGAGLKELTISFEKWKIVAKNCIVDASKGGIVSKEVVLRTGSLDFPAGNLLINENDFILEEFEIKKLPLGKDVASIDIAPGCSFQFGLDPKCGMDGGPHLMVALLNDSGTRPVGGIKGLPGFKQDLVFQSIKLTSDGGEVMGFATNSQKIRLYDVVDFLPYTINSYEDEFNLDGAIDYGIPRVPTNINYKLIFKKGKKGKIDMQLGVSDVSFRTEGIFNSLASRKGTDHQLITDGQVKLHGTIHEPGHLEPLRVVVWKKRTSPGQYRIWMEREDPKRAQTIRLGGTTPGEPEFLVEKSDMVILPEKNDWDLLRLKLVPSDTYGGNSGLGTKPMYFELGGELRTDITVDPQEQQIALVGTNIDPETNEQSKTGLTGFKFVYDFPTQQLLGSMIIRDQNIGGVKFGGVLEMAIGKPGFYFASAGTMQVSPFGKINAGFLIGYYDQQIPMHIWQRMLQYSARNEIPCCLSQDKFRGFYALGALSVPFVTFDGSFDFGIAKGGVSIDVGAEASVYGSFHPGNNILGISAMIYADARAYLQAITCTSIDAKVRATIKGDATVKLNEPYTASLKLCGDMLVSGCLKQEVLFLTKDGFTCVPPPVLPHKIDFSMPLHAGITASIDLKGSKKPRVDKISYGRGLSEKMGCAVAVDNYTKKTCD